MSVEYRPSVGRVSVEFRSSVSRDRPRYRPTSRATLSVECLSSVCRVSAEVVSVECRPRCRSSIGRVSAELSTDSVGQVSVDSRPTLSVTYPPTLSVEGRSSIGRVLAECRPSCRPIVSVECRSIVVRHCRSSIHRHYRLRVGRVSAEISSDILHPHTPPTSRLTLGRHLGEISTDTWSSVSRNALQVSSLSVATIGRYLVGMSVYTRSTPRPTYSTDISADTRPTVGRYLAKSRPRCRSSVGRDVGR